VEYFYARVQVDAPGIYVLSKETPDGLDLAFGYAGDDPEPLERALESLRDQLKYVSEDMGVFARTWRASNRIVRGIKSYEPAYIERLRNLTR
jgi:hypothetical protein